MTKYPIFLTLILFVQGCIPIPVPYGPYYQPTYPDPSATVIRKDCHGQSGEAIGVGFKIEGGIDVTVKTSGSSYADHRQHLYIAMDIPAGVTTEFLSDQIVFESDGQSVNLPVPTLQVSSFASADTNATFVREALCPVSDEVLEREKLNPFYGLWYWNKEGAYAGFVPSRLELQLPSIVVDNRPVRMEPLQLKLEKRKDNLSYRTSKMEKERDERYEACVKNTPQLHCKNILEVYQEGFRIENSEFDITGRAGGWGDSIGVGVNEMKVLTDKPWQYLSPEIVLKDVASGEIQRRNLSRVYTHCGPYTVPFQTPLQTPVGYVKGNSLVFFNGVVQGLPSQSKIIVRIPSLMINGKRFDFQPLLLELRLLDGGFPPFNC